jgi:hypothetical protein
MLYMRADKNSKSCTYYSIVDKAHVQKLLIIIGLKYF